MLPGENLFRFGFLYYFLGQLIWHYVMGANEAIRSITKMHQAYIRFLAVGGLANISSCMGSRVYSSRDKETE